MRRFGLTCSITVFLVLSNPVFAEEPNLVIAEEHGQLALSAGFEFVSWGKSPESGFGWGWMVGYEFPSDNDVLLGVEFNSYRDQNFDTSYFYDPLEARISYNAVYMTVRPRELKYVQFKIGLVNGTHQTLASDYSGTGAAFGISLTTGPNGPIRVHWLDYQVINLGNRGFNSWNIGVATIIMLGAH